MPAQQVFTLEIIDIGGGDFQAQVSTMPITWTNDALPIVTFRLPHMDEELEDILAALNGERQLDLRQREEIARQFGQMLFNLIFRDEIKNAYIESYKAAASQSRSLPVRLVLDNAGALNNFPWEFLHDETDYLSLSSSTPIVRYPKQEVTRISVKITAPIRLLVMIASPVDLPPLNVATERANLEKATVKLRETGELEIDYLENATLRDLQRKLREQEYHIFHFIGHSGYNAETGEGWLALLDRLGEKSHEPVRGADLARELSEENSIRLVVLNSCHGAYADVFNPAGGIANNLVMRGIPAVVANQFQVSNEAATLFAEDFYSAIADDLPVDEAVSEARRAVRGALKNTEWATPVLYLRQDGALFATREFVMPKLTDENTVESNDNRIPIYIGGSALGFVTLIVAILVLLSVFNGDDSTPTSTPSPEIDLQVSSMEFSSRSPAPGEFVNVAIEIENLSGADSPPTRLEFLGNDQDGRTLEIRTIPAIRAGEKQLVQIPYRFNWFGTFISLSIIDPNSNLDDPDRRNNIGTLPVVTSTSKPFVINFSNALPDGERVRESQVIGEGVFDLWGFRFSVDTETATVECTTAVPWFKVQADETVAVGSGLPDNPNQCVDLTLIVTLAEQKAGFAGTRSIRATFFNEDVEHIMQGFLDRERQHDFGFSSSNPANPQVVSLELGIFDRQNLLSAEFFNNNGDILMTQIEFGSP